MTTFENAVGNGVETTTLAAAEADALDRIDETQS